MHDKSIELGKCVFVEQEIETLARGKFSLGVLRLDTLLTSAEFSFGAAALEKLEFFPHAHRGEKLTLAELTIYPYYRNQRTRSHGASSCSAWKTSRSR